MIDIDGDASAGIPSARDRRENENKFQLEMRTEEREE
jgi:hypothetical protein